MNKERRTLKKFSDIIRGVFAGRSVEYVATELRELENIFALLILGSFIGLPSPPSTISIRLLPHMGRELLIMTRISERLDDMLGEMAGLFDIT
ncbi:conserved hypothetical protein [Staphylothermus marinus F1]|uniref:Uncharacterized protein n=1 Tax=Staphylothermus marinus (strain ATCC 43588 / DSM 3639 / JCM 9404 / F1) TaxID=399550 RepID=A3DKU9_STAMF|nr:hypothetical protein [Staphylothermus marinus]ABN69259.1 conserved hypothetical protein [Staphylothermus marinus F1]